ncbi:MAG: iron ABC transporter permease [Actinobacteria bacterium]|nr:iron ABC transporter permease [Actinomycetota bacterium]
MTAPVTSADRPAAGHAPAPPPDHDGRRSRARGAAGGRPSWVAVAATGVAVVTVLPVLVVVGAALAADPAATARFLLRPRVAELLGNTVALVVLSGAACLVIGTGAGWLVERTALPLRGLWRVLLVAPLAVPAFVNSYAWVSLRPGTDGLAGAVLVTTLSYFPFVFLPVAAALRGLDPALEESARSLGLRRTAVFVRVVLPQLRTAALGGLLLVTLHLLAEFGALELIRFPTFTVAILEQYDTSFTGASAEVLAVVLVALCLGLLALEQAARGRARYARLGPGTRRRAEAVPLGWWTAPALAGVAGLVALALAVPLGSLVRWLGADDDAFSETASDAAALVPAALTTVGLAVTAAAVTVLAAFPVAWLVTRRRGRAAALVERATYVASSLPGVVVALALVTLTVRNVPALYQSSALLVTAYVVLFLPRAVVSLRAALAQAPPELAEAARALGVGPWGALLRVVVPLALPGALAGFALVLVATSTELTATLLLAPTGTRTLATGFWSASASLDYAAAAPYAALMVALSAPLIWLLLRRPDEEVRR